eukprot:1154303-Pelagomonas_calceolata.AAC.3
MHKGLADRLRCSTWQQLSLSLLLLLTKERWLIPARPSGVAGPRGELGWLSSWVAALMGQGRLEVRACWADDLALGGIAEEGVGGESAASEAQTACTSVAAAEAAFAEDAAGWAGSEGELRLLVGSGSDLAGTHCAASPMPSGASARKGAITSFSPDSLRYVFGFSWRCEGTRVVYQTKS